MAEVLNALRPDRGTHAMSYDDQPLAPPTSPAPSVPRAFAAARQLLRANEGHRRAMETPLAIPGARFEHLMCCYENNRMHGDLKATEESCDQQAQNVQDLHHARGDEVVRLSCEAADLRKQLHEPEDVLTDPGRPAKQVVELDSLKLQGMAQRADLEKEKQRAREAQKEAVLHHAKLAVFRETNEQELRELRLHVLRRSGSRPSEETVREFQQQCEELHASASLLLAAFQQPALMPLPATAAIAAHPDVSSADSLEEFLAGLSARVRSLYVQLASVNSNVSPLA
mmetsp:Transcript_6314/g.17585  ORF Transcript_6314/g.17585 Transcript_6314/m.17585 type:complete len:284 (-) Transcript_6314:105-956(-)